MTLLAAYRARIAIASPSFASAVLVCMLFCAKADKQVVHAKDARVMHEVASNTVPRPNDSPVLVELFTSEGCSSCPPADALLAQLDRDQTVAGADIIVLGEHVDYWDSLGWHDRFSSPDLTNRQRLYQSYFKLDDVYTPQMVINGHWQLPGADTDGVHKTLEKAAADKVFPLQVSNVTTHSDKVTFTLESGPLLPEYVNIYVALVDPSDTTEVRAGENKGRTLHHAGVVRAFGLVGSAWHMKDIRRHLFTFQANFAGVPKTLDGMRLVIFTQMKHTGPIIGATVCILGPENRDVMIPQQSALPANRCAPSAI